MHRKPAELVIPSRLVARVSSEPLFIFTDASYEPKDGAFYCGLRGGFFLSYAPLLRELKCRPTNPR